MSNLTIEEKFFNNYLKSKTVFSNTIRNPERMKNLVKDYYELVGKYGNVSLKKMMTINPAQDNRVELLDNLFNGIYTPQQFLDFGERFNEIKDPPILAEGLTTELYLAALGKPPSIIKQEEKQVEKQIADEVEKELLEEEERLDVKTGLDLAFEPVKPTKPTVKSEPVTPKVEVKSVTPRLRGRTKAQQEATARGEGAGFKLSDEEEEEKPEAREPLPLEMTEPDPTPVEVAEGKFRPNENNDPIADLEPPTLSPDERDQQAIDVEVDRPPPQLPPPPPQPPQQQQQVETTDIQGRAEGQPIVERKVKSGLEDIPNKIDLIPKERLSADFKSAGELQNDIEYFFKMFPTLLRQIKQSYDNFPNKTLPYLRRIHRQIVALLQGGKGEKKKIGVILEGEEFIKQKLKEIILEMKAEGMTNEDLLVNVEGEDETKKNDFGNYEVVAGESGLLHSQREPVYRYIPKTLKTVVPAEKVLEDKAMRARTQNLPTRFRSLYTYNANRNQNNPFTKPTSQIKLKYLY
jgi:hypothetical protein